MELSGQDKDRRKRQEGNDQVQFLCQIVNALLNITTSFFWLLLNQRRANQFKNLVSFSTAKVSNEHKKKEGDKARTYSSLASSVFTSSFSVSCVIIFCRAKRNFSSSVGTVRRGERGKKEHGKQSWKERGREQSATRNKQQRSVLKYYSFIIRMQRRTMAEGQLESQLGKDSRERRERAKKEARSEL